MQQCTRYPQVLIVPFPVGDTMPPMDVKKRADGSVVGFIMTYNCSTFLEHLYDRIPKVLDGVIIVDDDSRDKVETERIAKKLGIQFFTHEHLGYGGNIRYALKKCLEMGAEYMVEIHGDGQFDPSVIPAALEKIREGYDLVLGSRFTELWQPLRDGMPYSRYFANIGLSTIGRFILRVNLTEMHNGFRVYSRNLIEKLPLEATSPDYLFGSQVIAQAVYFGLRIGEVPIRADYRKDHTSISVGKSAVYAFQTLYTQLLFILARLGCKIHIFQRSSLFD
jgi:glycosyltransferase involved in cell wall biosynthesis